MLLIILFGMYLFIKAAGGLKFLFWCLIAFIAFVFIVNTIAESVEFSSKEEEIEYYQKYRLGNRDLTYEKYREGKCEMWDKPRY